MKNIKRTKRILGLKYKRCFARFIGELEKDALRNKVSTLPISQHYPYDPEAKLLRCISINPSPIFDIGANTGFYSSILEDIVGSENLYIFEPIPYLYQFLKKRFKNAHVFNFALSDIEGIQCLQVPYINGKLYDTRATLNKHDEINQTDIEEIGVKSIPLDKLVEKLELESIGLIKIDVEGHELEVLNGGIDTIAYFRPLILIEIESRHHKEPITTIFKILEDIGFNGYYLNPDHMDLLKINQFNIERDQNQKFLISRDFLRYINNFFFVHGSSADDFVSKAMNFLESEKRLVEQTAVAGANKPHC